jgi:hypothetical protein
VKGRCWFATLPGAGRCDGSLVKCHLISKDRLKKEFPKGAVLVAGKWERELPPGAGPKDDGFYIDCIDGRDFGGMGGCDWRGGAIHDPRCPHANGVEWRRRSLHALLNDPRVWVWGCGGAMGLSGHHGMVDSHRLPISRSAIPSDLETYAEELGLAWELDRAYGPLRASER